MLPIKYKKLYSVAMPPRKAHDTDAGFDLFSIERVNIPSQSSKAISVGLAFEIPDGYFMKVFDRSGMATSSSTTVVAGVVDSGYRGEVKVVLANYGDFPLTIEPKTAIAQFVLLPVPSVTLEEVSELATSERGEKGFGSTEKKETK